MGNWLLKCSNAEIIRHVFIFSSPKPKTANIHGNEHSLKFINTDTNSDTYECEVIIKRTDYNVEVRLGVISSILAYPAFEQFWIYGSGNYKEAAKTYNKIIHTIEDIKIDYEAEIVPGSTLSAMIREAMRPIDPMHKETMRQVPLNESIFIEGS